MRFHGCLKYRILFCQVSSISVEELFPASCGRTCLGTDTCQESAAPQTYQQCFSSIVGIVYLGLRMALLMVWLGSMHIRSFLFGFSFTRMFESQSVGCVTGFMMPSLVSLSNSSFTLSSFAMVTWRTWHVLAWHWDPARCARGFLEDFHALAWIRSSSTVIHRPSSAFLRLPSRQRTPSSNLGLVHFFHWEELVSHLERLPQGNLWCESCPFSRSTRSPGLQDA